METISKTEFENLYEIKIFPNPGSDYINIEFPKGGIFESLYLTNNLGRIFLGVL